MYDQVAELVENLSPLIRVALRVLIVFAIGIGMFIVLILQEAYLRIPAEIGDENRRKARDSREPMTPTVRSVVSRNNHLRLQLAPPACHQEI